ncbi:PhoU domain-containing protein [Pectinatus haikarae]|uniref:Phosphate uptake regulator n=1 Tax=Pectinatus haikarae TaxID=349096 RepID=A0ABT9YBC7_9FIRM|nr:PhoU domain-containing protein [Pectinatus haikarae]MDQ0205016.1 phosphate uptake regulator [Pectinatus haikarae]
MFKNRQKTAAKNSIKALLNFDKKLAAQVMENDDIIDQLLIETEDACILLIAKQQPIAHDLRVIEINPCKYCKVYGQYKHIML